MRMAAQYEMLTQLAKAGTKLDFGQDLFVKFYQAFIASNRWQQYLKGVIPTLYVTAIALTIGVVLGSEMSGGIRNVVVSSCVFYETDRGIRLKTRRGRGGTVEGIQLNNLVMEKVMCPFVFNMYYFCGANGKMKHVWDKAPYPVTDATPCLRDVVISDVRARQCTACAGFFYGLAEMPVEGVKMQNVVVEMVDGAPGRPAMMDGCPEMQRAGFYLRNAADVDLRGVAVRGVQGDWLDADDSVRLV